MLRFVVLTLLVETALVAWLLVWAPLQSRRRLRALEAEMASRPEAQIDFFRRFMVRWWCIALVGGGALVGSGTPLYLQPPRWTAEALRLYLVAVGTLAVTLVLMAGSRRYRALLRNQLHQLRLARLLFPRSARAARWLVAVALTAGLCEELAYRLVVPIWTLRVAWESTWTPLVVSSLGFGLGHLYQGARGVILTALLGALFYMLVAWTGSLWPAIALHALVDLRVVALYALVGPLEDRSS
jgi:membrane protease YdiL (CAAX protease family)